MRILALFSAGFSAAALFRGIFGIPWTIPCAAGSAIALGLFLVLRRHRTALCAAVVFIGISVGFLRCGIYDKSVLEPARGLDGQEGTYSGTVLRYPEEKSAGAAVELLLDGEKREAYRSSIYISGYDAALEPGDRVRFDGKLYYADTLYEEPTHIYLSRGILLSGSTKRMETTGRVSGLRFRLPRMERSVRDGIQRAFSEDTMPFALALLTGDRTEIKKDRDFSEAITVCGISHLLVVSGMHISFLAGLLYAFFGRSRPTLLISNGVVLLYAAMLGFTPSVTRALVMQIFASLALFFRKEEDGVTALLAALLILTAINPLSILSAGLQLSFAASLGLVVIAPGIRLAALEKGKVKKPRSLKRKLRKYVVRSFASTVGALAFTIPLSMWYFGSVSVFAPLLNILILPVTELVFSFSMISVMVGYFWLPAARVIAWPCGIGVKLIRWITVTAAEFPFTSVYTDNRSMLIWVLYLYVSFGILAIIKAKGRYFVRNGCVSLIVLCVLLMGEMFCADKTPLSVTVLDVGQGQCVAACSRGAVMFTDCGSTSIADASENAVRYMRSMGRDRAQGLVLTHFHADHINGVESLLRHIDIPVLFIPEPEEGDGDAEKIFALAEIYGADVQCIREPSTVPFGSAEAKLLPPTEGFGENEKGLTVLLSEGEYDALITGDLPEKSERMLTERYLLPDTELLIAGHHGAKTSSCLTLLRTVTPEYAAISVGRNTYGHPAPETVARLEGENIRVYRTDRDGSITFHAG